MHLRLSAKTIVAFCLLVLLLALLWVTGLGPLNDLATHLEHIRLAAAQSSAAARINEFILTSQVLLQRYLSTGEPADDNRFAAAIAEARTTLVTLRADLRGNTAAASVLEALETDLSRYEESAQDVFRRDRSELIRVGPKVLDPAALDLIVGRVHALQVQAAETADEAINGASAAGHQIRVNLLRGLELGFLAALLLTLWLVFSVDRRLTHFRHRLEHQLAEQQLLYETAVAMGSLRDLQGLLDTLTARVTAHTGARYGFLMLLEDDGALHVKAASGVALDEVRHLRLRPGVGITGWAAKTAEPVLANDVSNDPRYIAVVDQVRSELAIPLIVENQVIGVFNLESDRPDTFEGSDIKLLTTAASQAAAAIVNARLYQESGSRVDELTDLFEILETLAATNTVSEVVSFILIRMRSLFPNSAHALFLVDAKSKHLTLKAKSGSAAPGEGPLCQDPGACWALRRGKVFTVSNRLDEFGCNQAGGTWETGSYLCAPLIAAGTAIGVLHLAAEANSAFSARDQRLLQVVGEQAALGIQRAQLYAQLEQKVSELSTLYEVAATLSSSLELDKVVQSIVDMAIALTGADACSLMLVDGEHRELYIKAARGIEPEIIRSVRLPIGEGVAGWVAREGQPLAIRDVQADPRFRPAPGRGEFIRSLLAVPLRLGDEVIGVLNVDSKDYRDFTADEIKILYILANRAAMAIENARLYETTQALAITDGLTGLYNCRYLHQRLREEVERATRFGHQVSYVMMDLDNLKEYNDRFGHPAGDQAIRRIAEIIKQNVRTVDAAAKYGGDEFALVLTETDKAGAVAVAERIRVAIEGHLFPGDRRQPLVRLTVSQGVASFPEDATTHDKLVELADQALYKAKEGGRNRVVAAGHVEVW